MHSSSCLSTDPSLEMWCLKEKEVLPLTVSFPRGATLLLARPAALQTFKWFSSEMSLWPAPAPSAGTIPPRPLLSPIHL